MVGDAMQNIIQLIITLAFLCTVLIVSLYMVRWARKQLHMEYFIASLIKVKPRYYT
jgi:hypothetical protein